MQSAQVNGPETMLVFHGSAHRSQRGGTMRGIAAQQAAQHDPRRSRTGSSPPQTTQGEGSRTETISRPARAAESIRLT